MFVKLIPILNNNETNEKECFPPINGGLSEFIVYSICLPNNEVWYQNATVVISIDENKEISRMYFHNPDKNMSEWLDKTLISRSNTKSH